MSFRLPSVLCQLWLRLLARWWSGASLAVDAQVTHVATLWRAARSEPSRRYIDDEPTATIVVAVDDVGYGYSCEVYLLMRRELLR